MVLRHDVKEGKEAFIALTGTSRYPFKVQLYFYNTEVIVRQVCLLSSEQHGRSLALPVPK